MTIWSWHHFEELRHALYVTQQCFTLLKRIEAAADALTWPADADEALRLAGYGEGGRAWIGSIIPEEAGLSLEAVSVVLARMLGRGLIEDGPFPPTPLAQSPRSVTA